jgi:hypothetical protein
MRLRSADGQALYECMHICLCPVGCAERHLFSECCKMRDMYSSISRALLGVALAVLGTATGAWAQSSATITTLNVSSNNVFAGTSVALAASVVSGGTPVGAGLVMFCNSSAVHCSGSAVIGSAWMTKSGTASIHVTFGLGSHPIQAVFEGTNAYAASTSAATVVTVTGPPLATTTTINATGTSGSYTLTGTVTTGSAVAPTGTISFLDASNSNYLLTSAALAAPLLTSSYVTTSGPAGVSMNQTIAAGDFNNDGKLDFVMASQGSSATATIMLGNGDGTFTKGMSYAVGAWPTAAVVADFNGDGNLDIAFSNSAASGMTILLGNGDGTFSSAATPPVGWAASIAVGDFNGDGIADLAVSNNASDYVVTILLGNGDGTFTTGTSVPIPPWLVIPQGILAMDFNSDGKVDLAITSPDVNSPASYVVTILLGNGDGTFAAGQTYATGAFDISIAGGDFKGNGIFDLAIANYADNTVTILLGNGDGTFTPAATAATGAGPFQILAGDFNNDGKLDLATVNYRADKVTILLGNGDGTFAAASSSPATATSPDGIVTGDFNGDGLLDFVTANYNATTPSILLQAVTSTATATVSGVSVPGSGGTHNVFAAYSGDGTYQGSSSALLPLIPTPVATPVLSLASGSYPTEQTLTISDVTPGAVIYYTTNGNPPNTSSTSYTGAITVNTSETVSAIAVVGVSAISSVATASYTIAGVGQTITVTAAAPSSAAYNSQFTVAATASSGLTVTYTSSGGCTNSGATYTMTSGSTACSVIFNQAGNTNYAAATQVTESVTAMPASQTITVTATAPSSAAYNSQFTVAATASSGLTVTYTSSGGCTNSGATYTMTSGSTACSVIFNQPGNTNYAAATQVTESVSAAPGPATKLVFTTQPGGGTAGTAWTTQPAVTVEDAIGDKVTTSTASITLAIGTNPGGGRVVCTSDPISASSGVATFAGCQINAAGIGYTLTATSSGLTSATSGTFTIATGGAMQLVFTTQPGGGSVGVAWAQQPVVTLEDSYGNTVTGVAQNVTVALDYSSDPGNSAKLQGTTTVALVPSTGQATFTNLHISRAGTEFILTAIGSTVDTTANVVVSAPFNITSAAVVLAQGAGQSLAVPLASNTTSNTSTTWTAVTNSSLITVSPSSGTVTLGADGTASLNLTITASPSASNHAPRLPWSGGVIAFGVVLAGVPLTARRKRVVAILLAALGISALALTMSCGGGSSSPTPIARPAHNYLVTVTAANGAVIATIGVTVQ